VAVKVSATVKLVAYDAVKAYEEVVATYADIAAEALVA